MCKRIELAVLTAIAFGATGALANTQDKQQRGAYLGPDGRVSTPSEQMAAARTPQEEGRSRASAQGQSGKEAKSRQAAAGDAATYGVLIVPFQVASNDSLNNGCWARIYENPEFGGSHLTVVGPVEVRSLDGMAASDWNGADSIITGRSASVTAYDNKDFRDRVANIGPGQRNADMTGAFQKIQSLKVNCQGQG